MTAKNRRAAALHRYEPHLNEPDSLVKKFVLIVSGGDEHLIKLDW